MLFKTQRIWIVCVLIQPFCANSTLSCLLLQVGRTEHAIAGTHIEECSFLLFLLELGAAHRWSQGSHFTWVLIRLSECHCVDIGTLNAEISILCLILVARDWLNGAESLVLLRMMVLPQQWPVSILQLWGVWHLPLIATGIHSILNSYSFHFVSNKII